ncbi:MAG: hypothetical protein ACWGSQ_06450 [Longimicrobiales bacterium]
MVAVRGGSDGLPGVPSVQGLVSEDPVLRSRYRDYRTRQAQSLVSFLPHEAIRPLYARARAWAGESGIPVGKDPLATLLLFLQDLLPLPPFEIWLKDRSENLEAHLEEEFTSPPAHRRAAPPVTVESRAVRLGDSQWRASLNLFRRDEAWRGFISFRPVGDGPGVRTADIFREEDPEEIRRRFLAFQPHTLRAFLRSVLS